MMNRRCCGWLSLFVMVCVAGVWCADADAAVTLLGVQNQQDDWFPEYNCIWHDKNYPTWCSGTYLGGNVHVYLKNTGGAALTISDVTLAGYSLTTILPVSATAHNANSIYLYWDNQSVPADIRAAGIPVWFKGDPSTIPAGGVGQAVVRAGPTALQIHALSAGFAWGGSHGRGDGFSAVDHLRSVGEPPAHRERPALSGCSNLD